MLGRTDPTSGVASRSSPISLHLPHVVIIGGGFAGITTAQVSPTRRCGSRLRTATSTCLGRSLYQVATAMLEPAEVAYPIRTIFGKATNVGFRHAKVREVDHVRNVVLLEEVLEIAFYYLGGRHGRHGVLLWNPRSFPVRHAALLARGRAQVA